MPIKVAYQISRFRKICPDQGVCTGRTQDTGLEGRAVNEGLPKFSDLQKITLREF